MGRPGASLAGPSGMFLYPGLAAAARDLGARLGVVGAMPPVRLVDDHCLVNQGTVHWHVENEIVEVYALNGFARLILHCDLHNISMR